MQPLFSFPAISLLFAHSLQLISAKLPRDYIFRIQPATTWLEAQSICENEYDSNLATLENTDDFIVAFNYSSQGGYVGLTDYLQGEWQWMDGTQCQLATSSNESTFCSAFLEPNPDYNSTSNTTEASCSILAAQTHAIYDYECNDTQADLTRFYCNKVRGYYYVTQTMTHSDAEQYCQSQYGTHLATVQTYDVSNMKSAIPSAFNSINFWVGLVESNLTDTGNIWLDGTEHDTRNELVQLQAISACRSVDLAQHIIVDTDLCNATLPFLCNKRVKAREYLFHQQDITQAEAQSFCESEYGTDLATVTTEEELSEILRLTPIANSVWIGLRQMNGTLAWTDGTDCALDRNQTDLCVQFMWSRLNQPVFNESSAGDACVVLSDDGLLAAVPCDEQWHGFVCNVPSMSPAIPTTTDLPLFNTTDFALESTALLMPNTTDIPVVNTTELALMNTTDLPLFNTTDLPLFNTTDLPLFNTTDLPLFNTTDLTLNTTAVEQASLFQAAVAGYNLLSMSLPDIFISLSMIASELDEDPVQTYYWWIYQRFPDANTSGLDATSSGAGYNLLSMSLPDIFISLSMIAMELDEDPVQTYYWWIYQRFPDANTSGLDAIYNLYADVDAFNAEINKNATGDVVHKSIGNLLVCQDSNNTLCQQKIAPLHWQQQDEEIRSLLPIAVNTDWNTSNIVSVRTNAQSQHISVRMYFYAVCTEEALKQEAISSIKDAMFSSSSSSSGSTLTTYPYFAMGAMAADYDGVESVYQDWGNPSDWNATYDGYYLEPYSSQMIIYLYGLQASCPDEETYERLMTYFGEASNVSNVSTTELKTSFSEKDEGEGSGGGAEADETWMIVGIVFIVLFVLAAALSVYLWGKRDRGHGYVPKQKKGYQQTAVDDVELKTTNEDEDLL
eukprot:CAMPEP_0197072988 /NCGR_PEP_ID=MMETSP1384-20130603/210372_1 /TAXON_ID=29189 /ORGANISM="Ammonia sp." /LENGTH=898 /DNA_ID=CAMNT_0042511813 /DNA_START=85 /DNA_END=2782 /DNA_ORIENTATION=+